MKALLKNILFGSKAAEGVNPRLVKSIRILLVTTALSGTIGLMPDIASRAQRPNSQNAQNASGSNEGNKAPVGDDSTGRKAAAADSAFSTFEFDDSFFWGLSALGLMGAGLTAIFMIRRRRAFLASEFLDDEDSEFQENDMNTKVGRKSESPRPVESSLSVVKHNPVGVGAQNASSYSEAALFGGYR